MTKEQVIKNFISHHMKGSKMVIGHTYLPHGRRYGWNFHCQEQYYFDIEYVIYGSGFREWYSDHESLGNFKSHVSVHYRTFEKYLKEYCLKRVERYEKRYGAFK